MRSHQLFDNTRVAVTALALALLIVLTGCGGGSETLKKAYGNDAEQDGVAAQSVFKEIGAFSDAELDLAVAMNGEDIPASRRALKKMHASLTRAENRLLDVNGAKLSKAFEEYLAAITESTEASDRWIDYVGDDDVPANKRLEAKLLARLDKASSRALEVDRKFVDQLLDASSPEQRKEMREVIRQTKAENEKRLAE